MSSIDHLNHLISLAKATDGGPATTQIIISALKHKHVEFYGELLDLPSVQKLKGTPEFELLELFAFGNYTDYKKKEKSLPPLTDLQLFKLRQLTLVELAASSKGVIKYADCQAAIGVASVREMEDLVISCVYSNLIRARLDQKNLRILVDWAIGRDVRLESLDPLLTKLDKWTAKADVIIANLKTSMQHAEKAKEEWHRHHEAVKSQAEQLKKQVAAESENNLQSQGRQGGGSKTREMLPSREASHGSARGPPRR